MQVSVESTGTLGRRMTVALPSDDIESAVDERLRTIGRTARINGFRPGKVPFKVVRKRFEPQVRSEVLGTLIKRSLQDAIRQENIRLAGQPEIEAIDESPVAGGEEGGQSAPGFTYTAKFEVYPEFQPVFDGSIEVVRPTVEINDADIDEMIDSLRQQRTEHVPVERAAAKDDQVVMDFTGYIDDEAFEGGTAEKAPLVLGSNTMIPGFEDQLIGVSAGDERSIEVDFPERYQAGHLAGKRARFEVRVHEVREPRLPEIDEELVRSFGIEDGSVESLRADIRNNMTRELDQRIESEIKSQVMDALVRTNPIEVPESLVGEEIQRQKKQLMGQMPAGADASMLSDDLFREQSIKRVQLGLVVGEIISRHELKADAAAVRARVETLASSYQDPQEVIDHYYGNPDMLRNVEGLVLEEAVTERVLSEATVTDEARSFKDMMNPPKPAIPSVDEDEGGSQDDTAAQSPDADPQKA